MTTDELRKKIDEALPDCEELRLYRANRERDRMNPRLPVYHFHSPGGYLNDPCGYCFYKGIWHLFYQFVPEHSGQLVWGHSVSADRLHWLDLPAAIVPTIEICCGSGGTWVEEDRVIACYQGDLKSVPGGAIHIMESRDDLLLHWERVQAEPVITTYDSNVNRNPYCAFDPYLWKDGDTYCILSAGGGSLPHPYRVEDLDYRRFYLFTSNDLRNWKYQHSFVENDRFADFGDDGACPYFLPLGHKYLLLHFSHKSGGKYILGEYDRSSLKFTAESGGSFNSHSWVSGVHAPSAWADPDGSVHTIFNINYGYCSGPVNQIMSLPRRFRLGDDETLRQSPDVNTTALRLNGSGKQTVTVPANTELVLPDAEGTCLEIRLSVNTTSSASGNIFVPSHNIPVWEMRVLRSPDNSEYTAIRFYRNRSRMNWEVYKTVEPRWADAMESVLEVDTSNSTLDGKVAIHPTEFQEYYIAPEDDIELHIFVDRTIVEVFAGDKKCISVRTYPSLPDSNTVSLCSRGVPLTVNYELWQLSC